MVLKTNGTQKESKVIEIDQKPKHVLHYNIEYDSTHPEETIRKFVSSIKEMVSRYENDKIRIFELEAQEEDLKHSMEILPNQKVSDGYKLYKKMREIRKERRACKNEIDLLQPVYEYFHATEVLNKLSHVQGQCAIAREAIDGRVYSVRTDILDELLEPVNIEQKEAPVEPEETEKDLIDPIDPFIFDPDASNKNVKRGYVLAWKEGQA